MGRGNGRANAGPGAGFSDGILFDKRGARYESGGR